MLMKMSNCISPTIKAADQAGSPPSGSNPGQGTQISVDDLIQRLAKKQLYLLIGCFLYVKLPDDISQTVFEFFRMAQGLKGLQ